MSSVTSSGTTGSTETVCPTPGPTGSSDSASIDVVTGTGLTGSTNYVGSGTGATGTAEPASPSGETGTSGPAGCPEQFNFAGGATGSFETVSVDSDNNVLLLQQLNFIVFQVFVLKYREMIRTGSVLTTWSFPDFTATQGATCIGKSLNADNWTSILNMIYTYIVPTDETKASFEAAVKNTFMALGFSFDM